jgi:hypothetical protein
VRNFTGAHAIQDRIAAAIARLDGAPVVAVAPPSGGAGGP